MHSLFRDGQVAQLVEHATENRGVDGSIPPLATSEVTSFAVSSPVVVVVLVAAVAGAQPVPWSGTIGGRSVSCTSVPTFPDGPDEPRVAFLGLGAGVPLATRSMWAPGRWIA